mgnify:FL=1
MCLIYVSYCLLLVLLRILLQRLESTNKEKERFKQELNDYKKKYEDQNSEFEKLLCIKEEFIQLTQEHNDQIDINEELCNQNIELEAENQNLCEIIKAKSVAILYLTGRLKRLNRKQFNRQIVWVRK